MPRTHRPYDAQFRKQAIELLLQSGKSQLQLAEDLGVCVETLRAWKKRYEQKLAPATAAAGEPGALDLTRENQRLRKELTYTQQQRDILKKALAICSAQPGLLADSQ